MFKKLAPISQERHLKKRISKITNYDFAKDTHIASIMVHEFSRAASVYPIVFLEDPQNDIFRPVVLLGLEEGENLFVDHDIWKASYIPAIIRRYPFALYQTEEEGRYTILIDEESEFVSETEGEPLFDENGEPGKMIETVKKYLTELQQMEDFTKEFCEYLVSKNLFTPLNMKVKINNEVKSVSGAYIVNEERLNTLSNEVFLEMREKKYLSVIYAHLTSISQIERLIGFKDSSKNVTKADADEFELVH